VTGDCRARLRAARERGPLVFAGVLLLVMVAEIWAQAFGLRLLGALLGRGCEVRPVPSKVVSPPSAKNKALLKRLRVLQEDEARYMLGGI
jgi:hypothetical protein